MAGFRHLVPHVRAAFIGLVLLAHGIYALPLPSALTPADLREDWRQADIEMWRGWLAKAGIDVTREGIEQGMLGVTSVSGTVQSTLEAPFDPVFDALAIDQSWALFASTSTRPDRLVVSVRQGEDWEPVFRRLDPCCTWRDGQLRYRRIRGIWDGQKDRMRPAYRNLTRWIADQAFRDFPDATEVRVELERSHVTFPWDAPDPAIEIRHVRTHPRPRS
jgi:hypothetical protein